MSITRLRNLIDQTHLHGLAIKRELLALDKQGKSKSVRARALRVLLRTLETLNRKRRAELATLERPVAKPTNVPPARFAMYDSIEVSAIPRGARAVAGYVGGKWPTYNELVKQFPTAKRLSIAVNASEDAECLDVETGDATPAEAPAWFKRQRGRGVAKPVVYANASTMPAVEQALRDAGIHRWQYRTWVAHYTNIPHIEPGADATQYTERFQGRNCDASLCEPWFIS